VLAASLCRQARACRMVLRNHQPLETLPFSRIDCRHVQLYFVCPAKELTMRYAFIDPKRGYPLTLPAHHAARSHRWIMAGAVALAILLLAV
jgi:hypothetical protein